MSRTVLANVDGFTPVMDVIVNHLGLMPAVVFGRVWRYCQMKDQVCSASLEKIAEGIGVDRVTVLRHIKELCEHGYLEDTTPDLKNRPHVYVDTGKAQLILSLSGVAESNTTQKGVAQSNSGVAESNSTVAQKNRGVAESHLKIDLKKEFNKEKDTDAQKILDGIKQSLQWDLKNGAKAKLESAQAARFEENILTLVVADEDTRAWLESRMTATINNLLPGIVRTAATVEFVLAKAAE